MSNDLALDGTNCAHEPAPVQVATGQDVDIVPVVPDAVRETYVLPTFDGGEESFTEYLTYWPGSRRPGTFQAPRPAGRRTFSATRRVPM